MPIKKRQVADPVALPLTVSRPSLLVNGSDQTLRRVTLGLAVLSWMLADIRAGFGKLVHVSPFQYVVLQAIARVTTDEPWTVRAVAKYFRVTNAFVSMELRSLITQELVHAAPKVTDKRTKLLSVTPQGIQALVALAPVQQKVNDLLFSQFDAAGLEQINEVIARMLTDAERANDHLKLLLSSHENGL